MKTLLFLALFYPFYASNAAQTFEAGEPGCFTAIQGLAIDNEAAKLLPDACKEWRVFYLDTLKKYSQSDREIKEKIKKVILSEKKYRSPYNAILVAAQSEDAFFLQALKARSDIEKKLKLNYRYASAAVQRLTQKKCGDEFHLAAYDEVCRMRDPVLKRVIDLRKKIDENRGQK